jgi:hypothetical protein
MGLLDKMILNMFPNDLPHLKLSRISQFLQKLAIKRLINTHNPSIILLQELMTDEDKVVKDPSKLLKGWDFSFIDSLGRYMGNITS